MAPEQFIADPSMDHRADIYSFGMVAYELLAGQSSRSRTAPCARAFAARFTETPLNVRLLRPDTPEGLRRS